MNFLEDLFSLSSITRVNIDRMTTPTDPKKAAREKNAQHQRNFRAKHKHDMKELRRRYDENEWRRKLGLPILTEDGPK